MKNFSQIVTLFACCWALSAALPQGYQPQNPSNHRAPAPPTRSPGKCRTEYKPITEIVYEEKYYNEQKCEVAYREKCDTKYNDHCEPLHEQKCKTVYDDDCQVLYRDDCRELFRDKDEPYAEDECRDEYVRACEKHWVTTGHNEKAYVDDPSTCKDLKQTKCETVQKFRKIKESYTKCDKVPYEDCKKVARQSCKTVTREVCKKVPYKDCKQESWNDCKTVPVHKKVPKEVTTQKAVRVCGDKHNNNNNNNNNHSNNNNNHNNNNADDDDYDYDYVYDERTAVNAEDDERAGVNAKPKKDVIVFGVDPSDKRG